MKFGINALFNNVFTLKQSELHGPTCSYQCLWCKNEVLKKIVTSKASLSASKEWKYTTDQIHHLLFSPIDYCVGINGEPDRLFSGDIQS